VTFSEPTAVRCIRVGGEYPLGKSEGDKANLIWSGGLHIENNNNLDEIIANSNQWNGEGVGNRLAANTKADCNV